MKMNWRLVLFIFLISCKNENKRIIAKFPNGIPSVTIEYFDISDTSSYTINSFYRNGSIRQKAIIKNGNFVGPAITYYPDGRISEIDSIYETRKMSRNNWDGIAIRFYKNGKISERFVIKNAERNGLSQHYDTHGILVKEYSLIHDSVKNGIYTEFYSDGKVFLKDTYKNGIPVGFEYIFSEKGDTLKYSAFYEGSESFPIKKWLGNGTVLEGDFLDKEGNAVIWKWYNHNGKEIKRKISYPIKGQYISPE